MVKAVLVTVLILLFQGSGWAGSKATSGVTAQTVIDRARVDLNEVNEGFWKDTYLLRYTDEAVKEVVYKTRCLEAGASTFVISSQSRTFSLSGINFLDIEKVEYDSGVTWEPASAGTTTFNPVYIFDLTRVPFGNLRYGNEKERGAPKSFSVWNDTLYIWPIPGPEQSGTTLYVYYVPEPSGVTTTSSPIETPTYFDGAILDYIKGKGLERDEDPGAKYYLDKFDNRLLEYMMKVQKRYEIIPPQPAQ